MRGEEWKQLCLDLARKQEQRQKRSVNELDGDDDGGDDDDDDDEEDREEGEEEGDDEGGVGDRLSFVAEHCPKSLGVAMQCLQGEALGSAVRCKSTWLTYIYI